MADCGDLEKLPPEIRNEIYALVLVQAEPLALCNFKSEQKSIGENTSRSYRALRRSNECTRTLKPKVAPVGHKRSLKGRGHEYVQGKWTEVPSNVALLCVNKKIHMEAAPVLYSRSKFRFKSADTMRRFVNLIENNIRYIRDVGIFAGGWEYRRGFRAVRYAIEALAAAKSMHTLEISHVDICPNVSTRFRKYYYPGSHKAVELCRPLLKSLKIAYEADDLKASILEVIKIDDPKGREFEYGIYGDCGCEVEQATKDNVKLEHEIKQLIAEQHELESDAKDSSRIE
jgi:hypothetical protein